MYFELEQKTPSTPSTTIEHLSLLTLTPQMGLEAACKQPVVLLNSSQSLLAAVRSDVSSGPKEWYRRSAIIFSFSEAISTTVILQLFL